MTKRSRVTDRLGTNRPEVREGTNHSEVREPSREVYSVQRANRYEAPARSPVRNTREVNVRSIRSNYTFFFSPWLQDAGPRSPDTEHSDPCRGRWRLRRHRPVVARTGDEERESCRRTTPHRRLHVLAQPRRRIGGEPTGKSGIPSWRGRHLATNGHFSLHRNIVGGRTRAQRQRTGGARADLLRKADASCTNFWKFLPIY